MQQPQKHHDVTVPPIGASLLHFIRGEENVGHGICHHRDHQLSEQQISEQQRHRQNENEQMRCEDVESSSSYHKMAVDSSEFAAAAFDNSNDNNAATDAHHSSSFLLLTGRRQQQRRRILVCGPSKSGKTSLAMDLAYSKALIAKPCLCLDPQMCHCIAVTMYRCCRRRRRKTASTKMDAADDDDNDDDDDDFPICARQYHGRPPAASSFNKMNGNQRDDEDDDLRTNNHEKKDDCWDPRILKSIRIQYVTSVRELLHDMLSLLGKPLQDRPRGGGAIIIDDLDKIVALKNDSNRNKNKGGGGNSAKRAMDATSAATFGHRSASCSAAALQIGRFVVTIN
jgi:GTPase SAR1 family protein